MLILSSNIIHSTPHLEVFEAGGGSVTCRWREYVKLDNYFNGEQSDVVLLITIHLLLTKEQ